MIFYNIDVRVIICANISLLKAIHRKGVIYMKKSKNTIEKIVSKVAYKVAESNVNSNCTLFFYQPIVPEKVKVLKKKNV